MAGLDFSGIQQFDPHQEPSSLSARWKEWASRFQRCLIGLGIGDAKRKRALLLYLAGPAVERIFETLPDTGDDDDYKTAEAKLTEYFAPKRNPMYERHLFRQAR